VSDVVEVSDVQFAPPSWPKTLTIEVLSRDLSGGTDENHENLKIAGVPVEILIDHVLNRSPKRYL
jgi:hypothetical protein